MTRQLRLAVNKHDALRGQHIDLAFRKELEDALFSCTSSSHLLLKELTRPRHNLPLLRLVGLQSYQLVSFFSRYIGCLYHHCEIAYYRKRLAIRLYEEETGILSGTANHEALMRRFLRALGISDAERDEVPVLLGTQKLIDYRWQLVNNRDSFHMGVAAILIASEGQYLEEEIHRGRHVLLPMLYGLKPEDLAFFSVHTREDIFHVREGLDLTAEICLTSEQKDEALQAIYKTDNYFSRYYDGILEAYESSHSVNIAIQSNEHMRDACAC